jgi:hypothetical protein
VTCAIRAAGAVELNGVPIPKAVSTLEASQAIREFLDAGDPSIRLIPGSRRYNVCIAAPSRIPVLDAELPLADVPHSSPSRSKTAGSRADASSRAARPAPPGRSAGACTACAARR